VKVILLQDVPNVGRKYEVKDVASGYAANLLFPKGLAELATKKKLVRLKNYHIQREVEEKIQKDLLAKNLNSLKDISITVTAKANEQGHLFQGIHREDIVTALKEQAHVDLPPEYIRLKHPIKEVGEHKIEVSGGGGTASFRVTVQG
jgi:large subunit ribosomal protein L9